jgi:hypothetical protein
MPRYVRIFTPLVTALVAVLLIIILDGAGGVSDVRQIPVASSTAAALMPVIELSTTSPISVSASTSSDLPSVLQTLPSSSGVTANPAKVSAERLTAAGGRLLNSLVNIICIPSSASPFRGVSGTGVIIDSRGLILTAAHLGQYFLVQDYPRADSMRCVVRTGGPAQDAYIASLVYLSPSWIEENPSTLFESQPKGTGEDDFAILAITGSATDTPLPSSFTFIPLSQTNATLGEKIAIGSYAAQYLGSSQIEHDLYPTIVFNTIANRYTFDVDTPDVISVTGTPAAQEGSSGGGIVDAGSRLIGLITTSSITGDIKDRTLHAITPLHIRASFEADTGFSLDYYLANNSLSTLVDAFASEAGELARIIEPSRR